MTKALEGKVKKLSFPLYHLLSVTNSSYVLFFFFAISIPLFSSENIIINYSLVIYLLIYWFYSTLKCGSWELKFSARQEEDFLNVLIFFPKGDIQLFFDSPQHYLCPVCALHAENILPFFISGFVVCNVCLKDMSPAHPSYLFFS